MNAKNPLWFCCVVATLVLTNTAHAKKQNAEQEISAIVNDKIGVTQKRIVSEEELQRHFKKTITLKQALWIAANHNPDLQAKLAEAQISLTEMQELRRVESPQIDFATRFPVSSSAGNTAYEFTLTQNLMDIVQISSRQKMALKHHESKKWQIVHAILNEITEVKKAYYNHQAALALQSFSQDNLTAAKAEADLASGQKRAGNINQLDESQHHMLFNMAQLELIKSKNQVSQTRLDLAKRLGIPSFVTTLKISKTLAALPANDPNITQLKEIAAISRTDITAQKFKIAANKKSAQTAMTNWLPALRVGISTEFTAEGDQNVGPVIQMGLPFLGHGKARVQKAQAELVQSEKSLQALEKNLPYELEQAHAALTLARQTVRFYENQILPLQNHIIDESLKHYNYMLLGNYELLQSKQNQINAKRAVIEALRDYWNARADLELLTGGNY